MDTHEDVPERLEKEWVDLAARGKTGHVDIPRWREGGMTAPFLAAYVNAEYAKTGGAAKKALEFIDVIHRLVDAHPQDLVFADSVAGIRAAKKDGRIAVLIGIEGGHAIEDSLGALSSYYRLGVRYMTLTHTNTNNWADSSGSFWSLDFDPKKYVVHHGLTDHGREVVLEMNRLGMLVDVSHVSEDTVRDVLAVSKAPVFASHSSCRALSNIPRNLTDDQIKAIAAKGGIVMVNVSSMFLDQKAVDAYTAAKKAILPQVAAIRAAAEGRSQAARRRDPEARRHHHVSAGQLDPRRRSHRARDEAGGPRGRGARDGLRRHRGPARRPRGRLEAAEADRGAAAAGPQRRRGPGRPGRELPQVLGPGGSREEGHAGPNRADCLLEAPGRDTPARRAAPLLV